MLISTNVKAHVTADQVNRGHSTAALAAGNRLADLAAGKGREAVGADLLTDVLATVARATRAKYAGWFASCTA